MNTAEELKRQALQDELAHLDFQIANRHEDIKALRAQKLETILRLNKEIDELTVEREELALEVEFLHTQLQPTVDRLKQRELDLLTREKDINVIIERYQRLYAAEGVRFKI